ncbi:ABC transporter ATP-binding protein [Micromonospora sp. DT81.3]|uniref:ABC transporter ATP-binding protein n=1 Tax=Actinomycetes TaxID=1760 RepID=UPI003CEB3732
MSTLDRATGEEGPEVVVVDRVSKSFVLRKDNSLKERVVTLGRRGRAHQESFDALKDVSFTIRAGSSIGLLGTNGSGKSTLLKVIGGIIDPSSGTVLRRGRLAALLELGAGFHPDLSGRENVYLNAAILGLSKEETDAEFENILAFSEIGDFINSQVKFYSSGMYVRLAFAVAVHTNPDVLLVDEVLAVGDEAFQRKCMDKIRQFQREGRTIVLVSHSAEQVMEVCDRGVVLSQGEVAFIGSSVDATRVHREILEGKRKAAAGVAIESAEARLIPQIVSVLVRNASGDPVENISTGEEMMVEVQVDVPHDIDEWHSSLSIDTPNGQQVFGTGTRRNATRHGPSSAGRRIITYSFPSLPLAGGQYFVNAEVLAADGRPYDIQWQGAMFSVPALSTQTGVAHAEPAISVR